MAKEEDIVTFTFAELAFMLMYAIFASFYLGGDKFGKTIETLKKERDEAQSQVEKLNSDYEELKKREELIIKQTGLKSKQTPSCIEKGVPIISSNKVDFLFDVTILDASRYQVGDERHDIKSLLRGFEADIKNAEKCGCDHSIVVRHAPNIDIEDYLHAKALLALTFKIMEK